MEKLKTQKGNSIITTPIIIAIGMMLVSILIVLAVKILTPYLWYEKLSSTCIKYVFIMEEYGYLTSKEKNNLLEELEEQGFEKENIKINCTTKVQSYGSPIYLNVKYQYNLKLPLMEEQIVPMEISRSSVSKR